MTRLRDLLQEMKAAFTAAGLDTPELDARLLAQSVLQMTPEELFLQGDSVLGQDKEKAIRELMDTRLQRKPVSRILGTRAFWKSEFKVTDATLDPRADSETVIEAALKYGPSAPENVLDLGTGTGCLLLSLLIEWPTAKGVGLDISAEAVAVAKENAQCLDLSNRANFIAMDWATYHPEYLFDLVVSNPPYVAESEKDILGAEVMKYDPHLALFGGKDGFDGYRSLAKLLPTVMKKDAIAVLEIGYRQVSAVTGLFKSANFDIIDILRDLGGNDRAIVIKKL